MTVRNKASLTALFEQNDIPNGMDYADFIDSQLNIAETSAQSLASPLTVTELVTPRVSATNARFTGVVSAEGGIAFPGNAPLVITALGTNTIAISASADITISGKSTVNVNTSTCQFGADDSTGDVTLTTGRDFNLNIGRRIDAGGATLHCGIVSATSLNLTTGDVSAAASTVYASAVRSTRGFFSGVGVVSAAGTTQGAAAILTNAINRGKGIVDGSTTGFAPLANRAGLVQYLFNEGASANLWPPTGGTINGLAADAVFPLAASAMVTIVHLTASSYAVK